MKNSQKNGMLCVLFSLVGACFLFYAKKTAAYAYIGLKTWFDTMIVSLFPFLVLVNLLFLCDLTSQFITPLYLPLRFLLRITKESAFVMLFGFLCGFPLGGKCVVDFYKQGRLSKKNAEYLLAFCNNLGPTYLLGFVLTQILPDFSALHAVFLIYGTSLLYGLFLRYTIYKKALDRDFYAAQRALAGKQPTSFLASRAAFIRTSRSDAAAKPSLLTALPDAVQSALSQLTLLGGYMILFNALRILPDLLFLSCPPLYILTQSTMEISGGLLCLKVRISQDVPKVCFVFSALAFNGFCCHFQTFSLLNGTGLSVQKYMLHKIALCSITAIMTYLTLC